MCGWSWQHSMRAWRKQQCASRGMTRPFPFPLGAIQLLSSSLVRAIGNSPEVARFANAANSSTDLRARDSNEDVALGYWIQRQGRQQQLNVSYVYINSRATNLGCFRNGGLYQQPRADAIVIHRIKGAAGQLCACSLHLCTHAILFRVSPLTAWHTACRYVWRILHDGEPHKPLTCARDAAVELPKESFMLSNHFMDKVNRGEAAVSYDGKTNKISMRFLNLRLSRNVSSKLFGRAGRS
jgi:hypothetical protein